ncbi:MAG: hypothetical protein LBD32_01090 [Cytophagales bacterium]|nr:hypothetical protein [Cytophagales bacterium]
MFADFLFVITTLLIVWLGWSAGFARTFFAALAGFIAILAANKYPYQEGMNSYLIFLIATAFVVMIGAFTLKLIDFFYLNILDRISGMLLSVCVWLVVFVYVVIPTMISRAQIDVRNSYVYSVITNTVYPKTSFFKDYIPSFLEKHQK